MTMPMSADLLLPSEGRLMSDQMIITEKIRKISKNALLLTYQPTLTSGSLDAGIMNSMTKTNRNEFRFLIPLNQFLRLLFR